MNRASAKRDVILTAAFGLPFRKATPFFRSLARTGYSGQIVVFTANIGFRQRSLYAAAGATVIDHGVHLHRVLRRPLQALWWNVVRGLPDCGAFTPPLDRLQQPNLLRWSLYRRHLAQRRHEFDRVVMVDLRDVYFQGDPFATVDSDTLRIHAEERDLSVGQCAWNTACMRNAFGSVGLRRWGHLRISCSGVVAGGIAPVSSYLESFARVLPELRLPDHGTDQAIHIRLVHEDVCGMVRWQGNRCGDVLNLAAIREAESVSRDVRGRLLDDTGTPYAVVHQYDRHPALAEQLRTMSEKHP